MNFKESVNDLVSAENNLDTIKKNLIQLLKDEKLGHYTWGFEADIFYIKYDKKKIYQETDQHVGAVAKLLRIPKELWLLWANYVLIFSNNQIHELESDKKIKVFKQAFGKVIRPYFIEDLTGIKTVESNCLNCSGRFKKNILERNVLGRKFAVKICSKCGLGMRFPRATETELSKIYREEGYFGGDNTERGYFDYASEAPWRLEKAYRYLQKLEEVADISPGLARVLDVGSGYGYFQKALKDKGYSNIGVELAADAVKFSQQAYEVETLEGDIPALLKSKALKPESFDLITLWDVVEHFYDFRKDLHLISNLLKKGGYIALRTNNIDSLEFKVFGKFFHSIKYEHTFYYTKRSLKEIFEKLKIEETKVWTHSHLFLAFMKKTEKENTAKQNKGGDIFYVGQKN